MSSRMDALVHEREKQNREMARIVDTVFTKASDDQQIAKCEEVTVALACAISPDSTDLRDWVRECFAEGRRLRAAGGAHGR